MFLAELLRKHLGVVLLGALWVRPSACGYVPERFEEQHYLGSEPYDDGYKNDLDIDLMLFSLAFMVSCYFVLTLVYFAVKFFLRRYFRSGIALSGDGEGHVIGPAVNARWPSPLDDVNAVRDKLAAMSPEEQFYYKQGEEFIKQNPPLLIPDQLPGGSNTVDPIINEHTLRFIDEEGAHAWEFQPDPKLPNDSVLVENKTEITFLNYNYDVSVMTNLPIPRLNWVYYCEFKIFELNTAGSNNNNHLSQNELISFGLSTSPYPYFRLPGRHHHSVAYDSTGARRFNDSFELSAELSSIFPSCEKGDVIGIGYRTNSGTIFFTRNGKKLSEKSIGGHIKGWKFKYIYPVVGSNIPCKIHVNFGTYGFVYIEANVKKWGYAKSHGLKLPPPSYEDYGQDVLLESSYEDDATDNESISTTDGDIIDNEGHLLPPPPGFEFSVSPQPSDAGQFTLNSLPAEPPVYASDNQIDGEDNETAERLEHIVRDSDIRDSAYPGNELGKNTMANQFL
ncbi:Ear1p [Lachancea thermotolerans CBS 6340]|uniref:KLTH0F09614p n=1 Tax=Lachancea thermotolerans (strain ATCC 56472 / CBS 6340 / NRRL Y-8284) TaxID=559295 RepID=C5DL34_LACTC|nr:KLTH0F09614p [Lachancea thermotolerans CBS 6340]CAR24185.1 KLTH0F09614p [Lachancea thermotolerans CBS 6340]